MSILGYFARRRNKLVITFTLGYIAAFTVNALGSNNWEFLYYTLLMVGLIYLGIVINRYVHLATTVVVNLSLLGFLHLAGGNFSIGGVRLYDYYFVSGLLRYDNLVHAYGTFIATLLLYGLMERYTRVTLRRQYILFSMMLVLMAIGVGTVNELVEFFAVVFLGAAEQVGGYYNNSLDLFFNTLGAILATFMLYPFRPGSKTVTPFNLNDQANKAR